MYRIILILFLLLTLSDAKARAFDVNNLEKKEVTCKNINNTKTYQALCVAGTRNSKNCNGYTMVEGMGDIPAYGPLISSIPYFIKTPDIDISRLVNCKNFRGYITISNTPKSNLKSLSGSKTVIYENNYENFYLKKGNLFIDFSVFVTTHNVNENTKEFALESIQAITKHIKEYTNANIKHISNTGAAIFIDNITLAETMLIAHQYGNSRIMIRWQNGDINLFL